MNDQTAGTDRSVDQGAKASPRLALIEGTASGAAQAVAGASVAALVAACVGLVKTVGWEPTAIIGAIGVPWLVLLATGASWLLRRRGLRDASVAVVQTLSPRRQVRQFELQSLPVADQADLYSSFLTLEPMANVPAGRWLPAIDPVRSRDALDVKVLLAPFEAFGLKAPRSDIVSEEGLAAFDDAVKRLARAVGALAATRALDNRQLEALVELQGYLRCTELEPVRDGLGSIDAVVVFGARRGHAVRGRAAVSAIRQARRPPFVLLTGGTASPAVPISEADALWYFLRKVEQFNVPGDQLRLDHRPQNLREATLLMVEQLQEWAQIRNSRLRLALVGAPFAMRRTVMLAREATRHLPLVEAWVSLPSTPTRDLGAFIASSATRQEAEFWAQAYVGEIGKLIAGRAVGQF